MSDARAGRLVFLVAGEPSGDVLGARLMAALKARDPAVRFAGVGGPGMAAEGLDSLFPMSDLAVMGLTEVLPHLPRLLRRIAQTVEAAVRLRPDAVVTIDSPGFSFRVGRRLRGRAGPLIHYVAPTVWAWKPWRARRIAGFLDHLLVLLPFEPPYFEAVGLPCTFVGHPVVEGGADSGDGQAFRRRHGVPETAPVLCVLPGSRRSETDRLLPVFGDTLAELARRHTELRVVVPTVDTVADHVTAAVARWPLPATVVRGESEKRDAFAAADAALAASGTVALELAMAGTPAVIAYKLGAATAWLVRRLIRVRYANLVNLILDREAVPELLQENCRPDRLAAAVDRLLSDPSSRTGQQSAADEALRALGRGGTSPSGRAAEVVLGLMGRQNDKEQGGPRHGHSEDRDTEAAPHHDPGPRPGAVARLLHAASRHAAVAAGRLSGRAIHPGLRGLR